MPRAKKVVSDVASPGETTASPTSRPIIVGHGPMLKDPMVQGEVADTSDKTSPSPSQKVITPPIKTEEPENPGTKSEAAVAPKPEKPAEPVEPPKDDSESDSDAEAEVGAVADQTKDKKKEEEALKAETERQIHLNQLVADKTYFVPLSVSHRKRAKRGWLVFGIVLLIALAAAAVAYQAQLF